MSVCVVEGRTVSVCVVEGGLVSVCVVVGGPVSVCCGGRTSECVLWREDQ